MLSSALEALAGWVGSVVAWGGVGGVAMIALFENLFPPTPSEWLYPLAGKMAYDGEISLIGVIIAGVIGSLIGSTIWYGIGYRLGEDNMRAFVERFGGVRLWRWHITFFKIEDYDNAMRLFKTRGSVVVFVARLMPLVHGVVSVPAGVAKMSLVPFYFYTTLGSLFWITPLTLFGYFLGSQWEQIIEWLDVYQTVWYILIGVAIVYYVIRRILNHRREQMNPSEGT